MEPDAPEELQWRDTYFILFHREGRPTLTQVEAAISDVSHAVQLENLEADEDGLFESLLVQAPDDHAALEVSYETGEAVTEQGLYLADQLRGEVDSEQLALLMQADARLDVMHFERVDSGQQVDDDQFPDDGLDPSSLLVVVDALVRLTGGLPIDPASGAIMT